MPVFGILCFFTVRDFCLSVFYHARLASIRPVVECLAYLDMLQLLDGRHIEMNSRSANGEAYRNNRQLGQRQALRI